jgi:hypothetical protein
MLYLYLDESGDLGFDFVNKKPSAFFTICVLAVKGHVNDRALANAVKTVIRRKLPKRQKGITNELKGNTLPLEIKRYFYRQVQDLDFQLYAVTLDKKKVYGNLSIEKDRMYNFLARMALEKVRFKDAAIRVIMTVDKRGTGPETARFNDYILNQIKALIDLLVPLDIIHLSSQESYGLQATDIFAWGFQRKHEKNDREWHYVFKEKIRSERLY